jgi:hypothetical protein
LEVGRRKIVPNLAAALWKGPNVTVAVAVANAVAPTDAEWEGYMQIVEQNIGLPNAHGLALTDGGGPNASQRARVNSILARAGRPLFSAVVSDSPLVRGIVGALRLFHRETEAFSAAQVQDAMRFIAVPDAQWASLWTAVMEVDAMVSPQSTVVRRAARFLNGSIAQTHG